MGFLNPLLLFGLAAVSVPIIIHLLNRRKFQRVVWAAMRFLQLSVEKNQRRMRIEDMILLALRCLLIALLALALARPALRSAATDLFGQSKVAAVILLDNSYSMGMSDGAQTRFEKARLVAEQAIDSLPGGSSAALFLASDRADAVIPEPTFDLNLVRKSIREAKLTDRASDLSPAISRAIDTLKDRLSVRKEIFLITDGQAVAWRQLTEIERVLAAARQEVKAQVILINEHEERNLGISDLRVASGLTPVKQPIRFEVRVSNYGREEARDVRVALSVDAEPPSDEFTVPAIAPGGSRNVSLFARLRTQGYHAVTARFSQDRVDRLAADDRRTVAVRAIPEVRVLLVDGKGAADPRESATFFLRNALVPVAPAEAAGYFIKPVSVGPAEFSNARLDDYEAVVLADVAEFSEERVRALQDFVRRGGGLMIFPAARVNPAFYNEKLFRQAQLLPAALGSARGDAEAEASTFSLQEQNFEHPIVSLWNDPGAGTLSSARFFRAHELLLPAATNQSSGAVTGLVEQAGAPETVARFANGQVAVAERSHGLGRVILFASSADTSWNDLPVRPAFVPLIHRTLGALVQRQDEGLNVAVGQRFLHRVPADYLGRDASVTRPRAADVVREMRRIELLNGWPMIQYENTDESGLYEVALSEGAGQWKFAAQSEARESTLEELSPEQKLFLRKSAQVIEWAPGLSLKSLVERERSGWELWLPLAMLALALATVEMVLATWFSRSK